MRIGTRLLAASLVALGGCTPTPKEPTPLWTYDPQTYFDGSSFATSWFSRSHVLVTTHNGWSASSARLTALDPATGAVRWQRDRGEWVLHPGGAIAPLVLIGEPHQDVASAPETFSFLTEIDPATGRDTRRVSFDKPIHRHEAFFAHAGDRILCLGSPSLGAPRVLGAIDPATGRSLWQVPSTSEANYLNQPIILRDRVIFARPTPVAYALSDGHELFRVPARVSLVASPDGAHVYANAATGDGPGAASELQADGKLVARHAGPVVAASERFVAVHEGRPVALAVYRHGEATPVWSEPIGNRVSSWSVSFAGDRVVFFRVADGKVWAHDLTSGKERALAQLFSRFVISPDATGTTSATLWSPVVIDGMTAFVHGNTLGAYRVE